MKTAMQELMKWMEETDFMVNKGFIDKVNECLEKEKEQIIKAHGIKGWYKPSDKTSGTTTGEEYYNQKYNQDK